jgi:hypothetical protein
MSAEITGIMIGVHILTLQGMCGFQTSTLYQGQNYLEIMIHLRGDRIPDHKERGCLV